MVNLNAYGLVPMIKLYPDQQELVDNLKKSMTKNKSILMQSATGSGKTAMAIDMLAGAARKGKRATFVVPRRVLLKQTSLSFQEHDIEHGYIAAGKTTNPYSKCYIGMVDTMARRIDKLPKNDIVIIDECFTGETLISTNKGLKPIAEMSPNDIVYNATGFGEVEAVSKKKAETLYKVKLNDGTEIKCTGNHPLLSKQGWIRCQDLGLGDELISIQDMPLLWNTLPTTKEVSQKEWKSTGVCSNKERICCKEVLLDILLEEDGECNVDRWSSRESISDTKKNRAQTICSWWEWKRSNNTTKEDTRHDGGWMDSRNCNCNTGWTQKRGLSELLQGRCREFKIKNSHRGRRCKPQQPQSEDKRQEERRFSNFKRVESIKDYKPKGGEFVYNLQVNGHPSYFANGILAHNCHFGMGSLGAVIEHYKNQGSWVVGLSATPWKSSGKGMGCWFDDMVQGKPISWLIENKRLSDYKYYAGRTQLDLSGISINAGDYAKGELGEFMQEQRQIIGDCVNEYISKAMGRLHVVRCSSIKHSKQVCEQFIAAGIPAAHVDGDTDEKELGRIIKAYARRELLVLTFCDLLNFGFDLSQASGMDVCIESGSDLKPSKSLAGQLQYWGRILRMKNYPALIFDHVSNFKEHGLPCSEREWTLEDRKQGKKNSEPVPATNQCEQCYHIHKPAPSCPECGFIYKVKVRKKLEEVEGELHEINKEDAKKAARMEQGRAESLDDLIALGKKRGMKYPAQWAAKVLSARMRGKSV